MKRVHVKVEFIEEVLGTSSSDPEIHRKYIASKAEGEDKDKKMAEEIEAIGVDGVEEKATTVFPKLEDGTPFMWDYQWKGYFKDACSMLKRSGAKSAKLKAYKKDIDGTLFVSPRKVELVLPEGGEMGTCQRPLRASTPMGERVALASSETVPEGTTCEFDVILMKEDLLPYLIEWLDYGEWRGAGQWRNSGKGRFLYKAWEVAK